MDQPEGYIKKGQERKVCRLLKSLYSLKQSVLQWNKEIHKSLINMGFIQTQSDASMYFKFIEADIILVVIYINNVLFMGSNPKIMKEHKKDFMKIWKSRDLGEEKEYLGMHIIHNHSKQTITLDQCDYTNKVSK